MTDNDKIERVVELTAPLSRVWRALTDHEEFGQWFQVKLEGPFKVGEISRGRITFPGYEHFVWRVIVERMDHERLFSFRWHHNDALPDKGLADRGLADKELTDQPTMLVEFRLVATSNGTRLTVTESGFSAIPDPHRLEIFRQNAQGWDGQVKAIAAYVEA